MTEEFKRSFAIAATTVIKAIARHGNEDILIDIYGVSLKSNHLTPLISTYEQKFVYKSIAYLDALVSNRIQYFGMPISDVTHKFIPIAQASHELRYDLDLAISLFQDVLVRYTAELKNTIYELTEDLQLSPLESKIFDNFDIHTVSLMLSQFHLLHAYEKEDSYPVNKVKALYALEKGAKSFIENTMLEISVEETPSGVYIGAIKFIKKEG